MFKNLLKSSALILDTSKVFTVFHASISDHVYLLLKSNLFFKAYTSASIYSVKNFVNKDWVSYEKDTTPSLYLAYFLFN